MVKLNTLPQRIARAPLQRLATLTVREQQRPTGASWEQQRRSVLYDAGGLCQCATCKALGRLRAAHHVDHIVPLWEGGHPTDPANLQAINTECHAAKTAREALRRAQEGGATNPTAPVT